jgi:hypothetical protein
MKMSLQEYADKTIAEQYRQPLKDINEALLSVGWGFMPDDVDEYMPICCGKNVDVTTFIGHAYHAQCTECGKFIHDVRGPSFGNSWVNLIDSKLIDCDTHKAWISGVEQ